jgi:hypothetical protein
MNHARASKTSGVVRRIVMPAAALAALAASGCTSSGGGPEPNAVRNTAQTAPADLQLTCATAAATSFGVDSSGILPVASSQLDAQKYQVELDVKGSRASCVVDTAGNVLSVQKV